MSTELTLLVWSTAILGAYIAVQSILYRVQHGVLHAASARDRDAPPNLWLARAERSLRNLLETYAGFVALAVAIEISGRSDAMTVWGSHLWFWSRWVYLPLYMFGVAYLRSLVWIVGAIGLVLMFIGVAF